MNDFADLVWAIIKAIIYALIWGFLLYWLGYLMVWLFTRGKYPKNTGSLREDNFISGVGFLFLVVVWFGIAGYNNFFRVW
jgi:hypothetical protein